MSNYPIHQSIHVCSTNNICCGNRLIIRNDFPLWALFTPVNMTEMYKNGAIKMYEVYLKPNQTLSFRGRLVRLSLNFRHKNREYSVDFHLPCRYDKYTYNMSELLIQ